jgi:CRP-like cAMP-binding protein
LPRPDKVKSVPPLERLLYLKRLPTLGNLPAADLALIGDLAEERVFPKNSVVYREGEPIPAMHFVVEGAIAVRRHGRRLGTVGAGAGLGGLGLFAGDNEGVDAMAEEDTLTLELEADAVFELFEDRFSILQHIIRDLCRELVDLIVRLRLAPRMKDCPQLSALPPDLDLVERIFFLRQMEPFRKSSINALAELSRTITQVRFEPGTTLWKAGDSASWMLLLASGTVRCRVPAAPLPATEAEAAASPSPDFDYVVCAGHPVGALESLGELPRWHDAVTETTVVALQGNTDQVVDVFEDNFGMARDYLAVIARSVLRILETRLAEGESGPPSL